MGRAAVLTIGAELLDGRVLDTNAFFLSVLLTENGFDCTHSLSCGDDLEEIVRCASFLAERCDVVVTSGGIGPTTDDLTREALAALCGVSLIEDASALEHMRERYAKRGRALDPSNLKQALFPSGAAIVPNASGTAPGFSLAINANDSSCTFFSLPGVPSEMKQMASECVAPALRSHPTCGVAPEQFSLRVFGRPESQLNTIVGECELPGTIAVSYRASFPEIQLRFQSPNAEELKAAEKTLRSAIGPAYIYSDNPARNLPKTVHELLVEKNLTLGLAESCTGGSIASLLTDFPGSSNYLMGSTVTYSNAAKTTLLGVSEKTLSDYGAVSFETASEMARGARSVFNAELAVSVTGIAGPDGGTAEKPVGTFYLGFATSEECLAFHFLFSAERDKVRRYAAWMALDLLRRKLLDLPLLGTST